MFFVCLSIPVVTFIQFFVNSYSPIGLYSVISALSNGSAFRPLAVVDNLVLLT